MNVYFIRRESGEEVFVGEEGLGWQAQVLLATLSFSVENGKVGSLVGLTAHQPCSPDFEAAKAALESWL